MAQKPARAIELFEKRQVSRVVSDQEFPAVQYIYGDYFLKPEAIGVDFSEVCLYSPAMLKWLHFSCSPSM